MITGVPKNERWWLWALALWIVLALGPGLEIANKPLYIGYFPLLYVWSVAMWIVSILLAAVLAYKMKFHEVPLDITPLNPGEDESLEDNLVQGGKA